MIKRSISCVAGGRVAKEALISCITEHQGRLNRLNMLRRYVKNEHDILKRTRAANKPNNRLVHAFPRYITTMASGYLIGAPVSYADEKQDQALEGIAKQYARIEIQAKDMELARDASAYGRAVELLYADSAARPKCAPLDPREAFVVYDDTVELQPIFGVHFFRAVKNDGKDGAYHVNVYTDSRVERYVVDEIDDLKEAVPEASESHYFGGVPINEYFNDEDETGDFEPVITLIDAYNTLQSDRINDKEQFVDAVLLLHGFSMEDDAEGRTPAEQIRQDRILMLPGEKAGGEYLSNNLNEEQTEVLKKAIKEDIHKMSMVPDLTDKEFASDASGVAMRYKLLGFEQLVKNKERWFREGLRDRLRMFAHFMAIKGNPALDVDDVQITFTRSLPTNELELSQIVQALQDIVPDEILLKLLPFVQDPKAAMELLKQQKAEAAKMNAVAFGMPMNTPTGEPPEDEEGDEDGKPAA